MKKPPLLNLSTFSKVVILSTLLLPARSFAQPVVYGADGAGGFNGPVAPSPANVRFETTTECPTTTFNLFGFARNADNWGSGSYNGRAISDPGQGRAFSNSGYGNYGVATGISMPLGIFGDTALRACREAAASYAERKALQREQEVAGFCRGIIEGIDLAKSDLSEFPRAAKCKGLEIVDRKEQELSLLEKCLQLRTKYGIDFSRTDDQAFSYFQKEIGHCKGLKFTDLNIVSGKSAFNAAPGAGSEPRTNPDGYPVRIQLNQ